MRLIDTDELLKEVIGIHDGWLRPSEEWRSCEDNIRMAPTIPNNYIQGQKDLAEEIYNLIIFDEKSNELRFSMYPDYKESAYAFSDILMKILNLVKEKKDV